MDSNVLTDDLTDGLVEGSLGELDEGLVGPVLLESAFLGNRIFLDGNGNGIQDDGDAGVDGVTVILNGAGADGAFGTADDLRETGVTANGGYFGFDGLVGGRYRLTLPTVPSGYRVSPLDRGADGSLDSDLNPQTGSTAAVTIASSEYNKALDVGLVPTGNNASGGAAASFSSQGFNYGEVLQKSFLFYEAQRSGALPSDNRIAWRGNSALDDGQSVGLDLSGGYFDAGDHVKFNFPMAGAMTLLSWGVQEYRDGYARSGQLDEALDAIRWGTDFLLKSHVTSNGKTKEFWTQVGNPAIDQQVLELPELLSTERPAYKIDAQNPGTEMAAEAAASLAAASVIFRSTDGAYADRLLDNAIQLYEFAETYQGSYTVSLPEESTPYRPRTGYDDELAWGAAWIHRALKAEGSSSKEYLNKAEATYGSLNFGWTQDWDNKSQGAAILLAQETGKERYRNDVSDWLGNWLPGGAIARTSGGLAWLNGWGSNRLSANTAFLAGIYGDTVEDPSGRYGAFSKSQVDYLLGDNPRGSSYVVGFGNNSPQRVHHQAAAQFTTDAEFDGNRVNTNVIYGALVGGPTEANDFAYQDVRTDFRANEVSLEYNAGFTGAVARLYSKFGGRPLNDSQLNALPGVRIGSGGALASLAEGETGASDGVTVIDGTAADDDRSGTAGDDDLLGGAGNDFLAGLGGNDHLYGTSSSARGVGEKDFLNGGAGRDVFFLGDRNGAFYATGQWNDLAWIEDFQPGTDQLFLHGGATDYRVLQDGTTAWIMRGDDAIAGLPNTSNVNLGSFQYA